MDFCQYLYHRFLKGYSIPPTGAFSEENRKLIPLRTSELTAQPISQELLFEQGKMKEAATTKKRIKDGYHLENGKNFSRAGR